MRLISSVLIVENLGIAREFYESVLNQKILFDFGDSVSYHSGLTLHLRTHFLSLLDPNFSFSVPIETKPHPFVLYFESDNVADLAGALEPFPGKLIHPVTEQPWGQRVLRFLDPDGNIIEAGEPMEFVILRLFHEGASDFDIAQKTSMPLPFIQEFLQGKRLPNH